MTTKKITPAQLRFLQELSERSQTAIEDYKPAIALVSLGLATAVPSAYASVSYTITAAGKDFLSKKDVVK